LRSRVRWGSRGQEKRRSVVGWRGEGRGKGGRGGMNGDIIKEKREVQGVRRGVRGVGKRNREKGRGGSERE